MRLKMTIYLFHMLWLSKSATYNRSYLSKVSNIWLIINVHDKYWWTKSETHSHCCTWYDDQSQQHRDDHYCTYDRREFHWTWLVYHIQRHSRTLYKLGNKNNNHWPYFLFKLFQYLHHYQARLHLVPSVRQTQFNKFTI